MKILRCFTTSYLATGITTMYGKLQYDSAAHKGWQNILQVYYYHSRATRHKMSALWVLAYTVDRKILAPKAEDTSTICV